MEGGESSIDNGVMLPLVSELALFADFRPATAALDNLVGAGGLGLFEDPALQLTVSNYGRAVDVHNEIQAELVQFQLNQLRPHLSLGMKTSEEVHKKACCEVQQAQSKTVNVI
jgi:hypothetical protein